MSKRLTVTFTHTQNNFLILWLFNFSSFFAQREIRERESTENGGEARDRADINTSNTKSFNTGDTDSVRSEVTEAGVEQGREVVDGMDSVVVYIAEVSESDRDTNEESVD